MFLLIRRAISRNNLKKSEQLSLFDVPVLVHGSVRKDGTVVKPHIGIRKKHILPTEHIEQSDLFGHSDDHDTRVRRTGLESLLNKYGGPAQINLMIRGLSEEKRQDSIAKMAKIAKVTPEAFIDALASTEPATQPQLDLFTPDDIPETDKPTFSPTHYLSDGTPVIATDEHHVWQDAEGNEIEDDYARKILPVQHKEEILSVPLASFGVTAGTSKADRRRLNAAAIAILDKTEFTEQDKSILRQYSGNGGCGDSLNEFYTDPEVATAMWSVANRLGYQHGTFLEPSSGTGVFLHTAIEGFKATAIELDPVAAKIATILHGDRHEIQNASLERFATQDMRQFDVVLGNPPYGPRGFLAKDDKRNLSKAEEYFIDTSLDKTLPGGLCALVVPAGIMDSKNGRKFRERILRKAEFLGAQRMPNTAFEAAHTDVTADVVYFKKRPDDVAGALGVIDQKTLKSLGVWDDEFLAGSYFEGRGAGNVFGTAGTAMRAYGEVYTVNGTMHGVPEEIAKFVPDSISSTPNVPDILAAAGEQNRNKILNAAESRPYENKGKRGDVRIIDGIKYVLEGNPLRWHLVDDAIQTAAVSDAQGIAFEIDMLMRGEGADLEHIQAGIKEWVEKYGIPAKNANLLVAAATDKILYRFIGAVGNDGSMSDAVMGKSLEKIEGGFDAVALSLALASDAKSFTGRELAKALDKTWEDIEEQLIADDNYAYVGPDLWAPMDVYLTGELWPKFDAVNSVLADGDIEDKSIKHKYELQAQKLEEAIAPKPLDDVEINLASAFLPLNIITAWDESRIKEMQDNVPGNKYYQDLEPLKFTFKDGIYTITGSSYDSHLLEKYLNRTGVRQDDKPKVDRLNEEFKDWLLSSPYRDEVEDLYNRKFRGFVPVEFSDTPIDIPGVANQDKIKSYAWSGLRWLLASGRGICAADVGLGKSIRGLMLARISKLEGRAKKPIIVVPKSVLANWYAESQKWFPGTRVLTIGAEYEIVDGELKGRDDNANERKRKYHDLTQNDYDFILISEPAFQELDLDPITKGDIYEKDFWVQRGKALGQAGDKVVKRIRENYNQAIAKREFQDKTDAIYFNDLGIDMVLADEAHHYKSLFSVRNRYGESPKYFGGGGDSMRALDFNLKAKWLLENNGNKGVYGLTATPTKNSPLEIYNMISHIAPDAWESVGIRNSEEFVDRFCEFSRENAINLQGTIEDSLIVSGFKNMDELRDIMKRYIDRTTAEQVGLELPARRDHMHFVEMSPKQLEVYEGLRQELEEAANNKDSTGEAHVFSIMSRMSKAALDLEVLDPERYKGQKSPKYKTLAKHVLEGLPSGGQIIFSDSVVSHAKIVDALVEAGIPRDKIGIINAKEAKSSIQRQNIADKFNAGKLTVVVGNTDTMGEGLNLQMGTSDIHHLDTPWNAAALQQRNGRGLRQGNINEAVHIHTYLSKGSFDGYRYQTTSGKKDWQDMLWNGGNRVDNLAMEGKISRIDMQVAMSADPEATRAKLEGDQELAMQQLAAGQRIKVAEQFVKFQEMKRSFGEIKNKNTKSSDRLRERIRDTETSLKANKYFKGKAALDSNSAALINPDSGEVFHAGVAYESKSDDGVDKGKYVVTGVNIRNGTVTVRPYASTDTGRTRVFRIDQLSHGIDKFDYNKEAETEEVKTELSRQAAESLNNIKSYKDVMAMPAHVLEAANDSIQRQLKEGLTKYNIHDIPRDIPVINNETGKPELVPSYKFNSAVASAREGEKYDFLLPTEANKKLIEEAWAHEERNARMDTDYINVGRSRRGSTQKSVTHAVKKFDGADYDDKTRNPWRKLVSDLNGVPHESDYTGIESSVIKQLREKFQTDQLARVRSATTMEDALKEAMSLGKIENKEEGHLAKVKYPKKALAMLWAKAKELGVLGDNIEIHAPTDKTNKYTLKTYDSYAYGYGSGKGGPASVHNTLIGMALNSGEKNLALAMVESGTKHHPENNPIDTIKKLTQGYNHGKEQLKTALKIAEKAGLDTVTVSDFNADYNNGVLKPSQSYSFSDREKDKTRTVGELLRSKIDESK